MTNHTLVILSILVPGLAVASFMSGYYFGRATAYRDAEKRLRDLAHRMSLGLPESFYDFEK